MRLYQIDQLCTNPAHAGPTWLETDAQGLRQLKDKQGIPLQKWAWTTRGGLRECTRLARGKCCRVQVTEVPGRQTMEGC